LGSWAGVVRARLATHFRLAVLQVPNLRLDESNSKNEFIEHYFDIFDRTRAAAQPARTQLNAALTQMITALSTELLSSVGVGGGASRRFSELVKPATSWSAGC